jgi:hypothetical protein
MLCRPSVIGVVLGFRLFLDNSTLPRIIAMATNWPAYARLWTVATAGQSVASYTTTRDKTTRGACQVERTGMPPLRLDAGDILLPHGDAHIVYGGGGRHEFRDVTVTYRDNLRVKETEGVAIETELICGRLHLEATAENLLLATLPRVIVLRLAIQPGMDHCAGLVALIRQELSRIAPGRR